MLFAGSASVLAFRSYSAAVAAQSLWLPSGPRPFLWTLLTESLRGALDDGSLLAQVGPSSDDEQDKTDRAHQWEERHQGILPRQDCPNVGNTSDDAQDASPA